MDYELDDDINQAERGVAIALANLWLLREVRGTSKLPDTPTVFYCHPEEMFSGEAVAALQVGEKRVRVTLEIQNRHEDSDR